MNLRAWLPVGVLAVLCVAMGLVPSVARVVQDDTRLARARVLAVDDSAVSRTGLMEYGSQGLDVELLDGPDAGRRVRAANELRAQLDIDKKFAAGDIAAVSLPRKGLGPGETLVARDHWRLGWGGVLFASFSVLLIVFGGVTGAKALFSFVFSAFAVWKLLVPLCLRGWSATWTSFGVVSLLTGVIMYLVAGATRRGLVAFLGAMLGVLASLTLAAVFSTGMHVTGATMPFVQTLLYSGFPSLDLSDVFVGAVILASSGATMDLAMDIAAGQHEVVRHSPGISRAALLSSGLRVGRAVVGTMTTTLLLAYSGGYLTLLMVFAAQGTSPLVFLNSTLVSAELVKTLVGSFGLVLVAPFTALVGAWAFGGRSPRHPQGVHT